MIRLWATISNKLGITQDQGMLLYAFMRGWLKVIPHRQAEIVLNDIVGRFNLDAYDYSNTYGEQLFLKGVLTKTEAEVFSGNYHESQATTGETRDGRTPPAETGLQPPVHTGRT